MRLGRIDSSGLVRLDDAPANSQPWAVCLSGLALGDETKQEFGSIPSGVVRIVCRAHIQETSRTDAPRWDPASWERFNATCDSIQPSLIELGLTLCVRPHADDLLSDPHACRVFLDRHGAGPFQVVADPAALITPSMVTDAPTHLARIIETHGETEGVCALILTNTRPGETGSASVPLREGVLDPDLLFRLAETAWPADRPVILLDEDLTHFGPSLGL